MATAEARPDVLYGIRTSEPAERLSAADVMHSYKNLAQMEQASRCLKDVDVLICPIRRREQRRVRAHIFLCLLAYHLVWQLRRAFSPVLF